MSIKKVFKQHFKLVFNDEGQRECQCGFFIGNGGNAGKRHKKHAIQVLEQHEREREAAALEEAAANLARESDQFATTAERLTGHDNTRYHAYSAARQSIAHQLRDRAAQIRKETKTE